jgi:hypothetical protein
VALVSVQELQRIEGTGGRKKKRGLLSAVGAWEDFEGLEDVVEATYRQRKIAEDREKSITCPLVD